MWGALGVGDIGANGTPYCVQTAVVFNSMIRVQKELEGKWGSVDSSVPSGDSDVLTTEGFAAWVEQFCYRQSTVTCAQSPPGR